MKNPLALPLAILAASLILLVVAILMTPPVEVMEDPAFDLIVTAPGVLVQDPGAPAVGGDGTAPESPEGPLAADLP